MTQRESSEDYWVSKERFRLKLIQNDVKHDVNKARQLKEAKEKRNRKVMISHTLHTS
jgi:hypothetical protein